MSRLEPHFFEAAPPKLEIEERDGYLYVLYGGNPLTLDAIVTTINRVAAVIRSKGYDRVLLVRDAPLLESDENRRMVADLIRQSVQGEVRFAIVDIFGNDPVQARKAVESSRQAGWDLTGFDSEEEAANWLLNN